MPLTLPGRMQGKQLCRAPVPRGRRAPLGVAACLALWLLRWAHPPGLAARGYALPSPPRGAPKRNAARRRAAEGDGAEGAGEGDAALRARIAQLEKQLGERSAPKKPTQPPPAEEPVHPAVEDAFRAVVEDLPELVKANDARLGFMPDKQFLFSGTPDDKSQSIYRRRRATQERALKQQDAFQGAFRKAIKRGRELESVRKLLDLRKDGGSGLTRIEAQKEIEKLMKKSAVANLFFREMAKQIEENPIISSLLGGFSALVFTGLTLAFLTVLLPPLPTADPVE